jgi:hypothetical protein
MAKALKTKPTALSVDAYVESIPDEARRRDCRTLIGLMKKVTGMKPRMWGTSIVGFGSYHYKYASGHEGDAALSGFSSRKQDLTIYILAGFAKHAALLARLGKHRHSVSCLYVKRMSDIDQAVLGKLIASSVQEMQRRYPRGDRL